jgi:hypothetical protein
LRFACAKPPPSNGFVLATVLAGLLFVSLLLNWIFNPARELLQKLDRTEYDVISGEEPSAQAL